MCGIVGYTGDQQAAPILLAGLEKLEYRGYDSAGLAVRDGERVPEVVKAKGRLRALAEKTDNGRAMRGNCGIGHTRWATHGEPSENNAHPHCTDDRSVVAVHNGIIENYQEIREKLIKNGYTFYSDTDTEVAVKLIDHYYKKYNEGPLDAMARAMMRIRGTYALAVMFKDYPEEIFVARQDNPMIIGVGEGESFIASDVPPLLPYTRKVYYIGNQELGRLHKGEVTFYNIDQEEIQKELVTIEWDAEAAEKAETAEAAQPVQAESAAPAAAPVDIQPEVVQPESAVEEERTTEVQAAVVSEPSVKDFPASDAPADAPAEAASEEAKPAVTDDVKKTEQ